MKLNLAPAILIYYLLLHLTNESLAFNTNHQDSVTEIHIESEEFRRDAIGALSIAVASAHAIYRTLNQDEKRQVEIVLPEGRFFLTRPLLLGVGTSGKNGAPILIRGNKRGPTILSGAVQLEGGEELSAEEAPAFDKIARSHILRYRLPADAAQSIFVRQGGAVPPVADFSGPFSPGFTMREATWPMDGFHRIAEVFPGLRFRFSESIPSELTNIINNTNLSLHGYWGNDWSDEWVSVSSIKDGTFSIAGGQPVYGLNEGQRARIVGSASFIARPGDWFLHRAEGLIYLWPPSASHPPHLPTLESVVRVEGAKHIILSDIIIEGSRGNAVTVASANNIVLRRLAIQHAGLRGISISGNDNIVQDCDIQNTGQGGVYLTGGNRTTLARGGNIAVGNRISHFNSKVRTYRPAISLSGVGNGAIENLIEDGPHAGIIFSGNDHLVEKNFLTNLAKETGDVGAIYTGRDWTARGTVIRNNVLEDIKGPGLHGSRGIYLDDQASGIQVLQNIFLRVDQAVFIGGGRDNTVIGNLFIASSPAVHLDDRGKTWQKAATEDPRGDLRQRLEGVPYKGAAYSKYQGLANLLEREPGRPAGNVVGNNVVIDGIALRTEGRAISDLQVGKSVENESLCHLDKEKLKFMDFEEIAASCSSDRALNEIINIPWMALHCVKRRWHGIQFGSTPNKTLLECTSI